MNIRTRLRQWRFKIWQQPRGILIVEVILSIAVFVLFASGAIYFLAANLLTAQTVQRRAQAIAYVTEGVEAVQSIDRLAWNYLADTPDDTYGLDIVDNVWTLVAEPDHPNEDTRFTRTITIKDVYRNDVGDIIASTDPEAILDPHTRSVTVTLTWTVEADRDSQLSTEIYLTDWDAQALKQDTATDWALGKRNNVRVSQIDDGELQIVQPTMELGTITTGTDWQTIALANKYHQAVVVTSVLDDTNPTAPVTTRVRNVTSTSFDLKLSFPPDNFRPTSTNNAKVYYLVIESGTWALGDGATKIEAGVLKDVATVNCATCGSWNQGIDVVYQQIYAASPLVFHQVVTEHDSSWITSFVSDDTSEGNAPGTDGFQLALNGAEVTNTHGAEDVAYVVIAAEQMDKFEGIAFETDLTQQTLGGYTEPHRSEIFDQTYSVTPWVAVTQLSMAGANGSWSMLDTVTKNGITLYVDEDQTADEERAHIPEYGGYMAFASIGTYYLDDVAPIYNTPPMEVGKITGTTSGHLEVGTAIAQADWSTVTLKNTYTKPVVVASIVGVNNPEAPVSVRVRNASGNSFQVRLDFPPDLAPPSSKNDEKIYYVVVEAGVWTMGDGQTKVEAGMVDNVSRVNCSACGSWNDGVDRSYQHWYNSPPVVLHQVMSEHDASWITSFASDNTSATTAPGTDGFQLALNGAQVTTAHAPEDIGYIVFAAEQVDSSGGIAFETDVTGDVVTGYMNTHYSEALQRSYDSAPLVVAAQMSMDGVDGSWAMLETITNHDLTLYVDEDQTFDSERFHISEDIGYVAFAAASDFVLTDQSFLQKPVTVTLQNTYQNPVIITTPYFTNDVQSPASIRVYDVTSNSFTAILDMPTDNFAPADTDFSDDVYYFVTEAGQWQIGDLKFEAGIETVAAVGASTTSWTGQTVLFQHQYSSRPLVLHQVMSRQDDRWITSFVSRINDRTNPPDTTGMWLGLNAAQVTSSNTHSPEQIGWVALNTVGSQTIAEVALQTAWKDAFGGGHDNGCFSYTYGGDYAEPVAFLGQMSMDGTDGSWSSICSIDNITVGMHFEEDQSFDAERWHVPEAVGFLIFQQPFAFAGSVNTSKQIIGTYESPVFGNGDQRNFNILEWVEQVDCPNCDIKIQVRTADTPDAVTTATYVGPDGTTASSFDAAAGDVLALSHIEQPYLQYFIILTGTTAESPILEDVILTDYEN